MAMGLERSAQQIAAVSGVRLLIKLGKIPLSCFPPLPNDNPIHLFLSPLSSITNLLNLAAKPFTPLETKRPSTQHKCTHTKRLSATETLYSGRDSQELEKTSDAQLHGDKHWTLGLLAFSVYVQVCSVCLTCHTFNF